MVAGLKRTPVAKISASHNWNYPDPREGIGLYIHLPFCKSKCDYCDFNTYAGIETLQSPYMAALLSEIRAWGLLLDSPPVASIFIGGGTPSYMYAGAIAEVLDVVGRVFLVRDNAEITLEANPDDCEETAIQEWDAAGVNRLSIGVQSFDEKLLRVLGRRHSAERGVSAFKTARRHFDNISIDLMYGLPFQSGGQWNETLDTAISLETDHLSLYCLQIEPSTPMRKAVSRGVLPVPSDDLAADMYEHAMDTLMNAGFIHYEISNWARHNMTARHNLLYWKNAPYLGVGAGAHSSLFGRRFSNCLPPKEYIKLTSTLPRNCENLSNSDPVNVMREIGPVAMTETIECKTAIFETMMLGMRLAEGVSYDSFYSLFNVTIQDVYGEVFADLEDMGLVEFCGKSVQLSRKGKRLSNEVFSRLILE